MQEDLYNLEPSAYQSLDLSKLSQQELKELAYYLWSMWQDDGDLMKWREEKLLPLLSEDAFRLPGEDVDGE